MNMDCPAQTHGESCAAGMVEVFLSNGLAIKLDTADHAALKVAGYTRAWFLVKSGDGSGTVKTKAPGTQKPVPLSRLILRPPTTEQISYRDGDPLNLCRSNLVLSSVLRAERAAAKPAMAAPPAKPKRTQSRSVTPSPSHRLPKTPRVAKPAPDPAGVAANREVAKAARARWRLIADRIAHGVCLPPEIVATLTDAERRRVPDCYGPDITGRSVEVEPPPDLSRYLAAVARRFAGDPEAAARHVAQWGPGRRRPDGASLYRPRFGLEARDATAPNAEG